MARGKYGAKAESRRNEELELELAGAQEELRRARETIADLTLERNGLRSKDASTRMREAGRLAAADLRAQHENHQRELTAEKARTSMLLAYLVDVLADVNSGKIGAGQTPGDLPGLLHHYSDRPGELWARVVGAHDSTDPDVAVMASRRNRRADVNGYQAEASRRREHGLDDDPSYAVLGDPNAWKSRIRGWEELT